MKRVKINPRLDYKQKIQDLGFNFDDNYWLENAYYEFTEEEILEIELASNSCHEMYIEATEHVIKNNLWSKLHIPLNLVPKIIESWEYDQLSLYGRFDFVLVNGIPKLLEFNADTPTSLLEASIIQWHWKEEVLKVKDQFNSIDEALIQSFKDIADEYQINADEEYLDFGCIMDNLEDASTTSYLCSCAAGAGISTTIFDISQMTWDGEFHCTPSGEQSKLMFKLYPWEWMMNEEGQETLETTQTVFIEPFWKAIWSNKYMLVILAELFPNSPYILKATEIRPAWDHCKKPIFSREGANVTLVKNGKTIDETGGEYGEEGYIYQELVDIPCFDGMYPVLGSWIVGGESCGLGIRENETRITNNMSYFVPHVF